MGRAGQVSQDAGATGDATDSGLNDDDPQQSAEAAGPNRYLVDLGERVRLMRAVRGMSRRVLATESGVSERYIAQLESGQGNVSIMLLRRVAMAAGAQIEDLVADQDRLPRDWPLIRELMRKAGADVIQDIRALLSGHPIGRSGNDFLMRPDRVALIGLRGAGKTTLGRLAAEKLGWRFVELNREIESDAGFSISEVFSFYGQDGYRRFEQSALERVINEPGAIVLATGGGIVSGPVTLERLLANFFTVWVKTTPSEHMNRVRIQGDLRPMATEKTAMSELITILQSRELFYARARTSVDTAGVSVDKSLKALLLIIQSHSAVQMPRAMKRALGNNKAVSKQIHINGED